MADGLAIEGAFPADRAEARTLRWRATCLETGISDTINMVEKKGAWATGHYVPKSKGT
jgi:hypothetical protein